MKRAGILLLFLTVLVLLSRFSPLRRDPFDPLWKAMTFGKTAEVKALLNGDPSLARKQLRFGREFPLMLAVNCSNSTELIDLLIAHGADVNQRSGGFQLTPLQQAVWSGKTGAVEALIRHKADVNATTKDGQTSLHYAVAVYQGSQQQMGQKLIELLLEHGANINQGSPILLAALNYANSKQLVEFLLSKGADVNARSHFDSSSPLDRAILSGDKDLMRLMLRYNPDLRPLKNVEGTLLSTAFDRGYLELVTALQNQSFLGNTNSVGYWAARGSPEQLREFLKQNPGKLTERDVFGAGGLHHAALAGRLDNVNALLDLGDDLDAVDASGLSPLEFAAFAGHETLVNRFLHLHAKRADQALIYAVKQGHIGIADLLVQNGANPNYRDRFSLQTSLHVAVSRGDIEMARHLMGSGASASSRDRNGYTPVLCAVMAQSNAKEMLDLLFDAGAVLRDADGSFLSVFGYWACGTGDTNVANLLLSKKIDLNKRDSEGRAPLHHAANQGTYQAVEWLVTHGADVNARDKNGSTALGQLGSHRRGSFRRKDVADLLIKFGAKR